MNWKDQLTTRGQHTLAQNENEHSFEHLLLSSPSDWGVIRNGGKNGARFAPQALMAHFKKMAFHLDNQKWSLYQVSNEIAEAQNFTQSQFKSSQNIETLLEQNSMVKSIIHLGAGHDHIYPLTRALLSRYDKVLIINIDAHLDTRMDDSPHSGTPFRQIQKEFGTKRVSLAQVGIHQYANIPANYEEMEQMDVLTMEEIKWDKQLKQWLDKVLVMNQGPLIISLDCDGLDGSIMPAVSAANHHGLNKHQMDMILEAGLNYWHKYQHPRIFGLYEYNPLYDDLHTTSGRYLASLIHKVYSHA